MNAFDYICTVVSIVCICLFVLLVFNSDNR